MNAGAMKMISGEIVMLVKKYEIREYAIKPGDSEEEIQRKRKMHPLYVEPPGKWPPTFGNCTPRNYPELMENLRRRDFKAVRKMGVVWWDPGTKQWMEFNDDFTPEKWSGTPRKPLIPEAKPLPPKPAEQGSLF
jgi:hypothetical protein